MLLIALDELTGSAMASALSRREWDVVVIGGGIRKPEALLPLFEQAVNLVRRHAPGRPVRPVARLLGLRAGSLSCR
jgi:hypothetical protein